MKKFSQKNISLYKISYTKKKTIIRNPYYILKK